jgi:tripartite-type tricarboxylate transporter receptor subunit TctC
LPKIPTSKEAGLPEFQAVPWVALFAPKGTPRPILDQLTDALDKALDDEKVRNRLVDTGGDIPSKEQRGQRALATLAESEIAYWKPIIRAANVVLD